MWKCEISHQLPECRHKARYENILVLDSSSAVESASML